MIGWARVSSELVSRRNLLEWVVKKFRAKCDASAFWMQIFHHLWANIGMQKGIWNYGIERGLFNPNSFTTTRGKTSSGRLALQEKWKFMAAKFERCFFFFSFYFRRLIFQKEASLSPVKSRRFVVTYSFGCERRTKTSRSFFFFLQLARTLFFTNFIDQNSNSAWRKQASNKCE